MDPMGQPINRLFTNVVTTGQKQVIRLTEPSGRYAERHDTPFNGGVKPHLFRHQYTSRLTRCARAL
jgi:hypothetical protein